MAFGDTLGLLKDATDREIVAESARRALAYERAGRFRDAWRAWEDLRTTYPGRSDWNAPLAASYLRFAFAWTADGSEGSLREAEEALLRGVAILTIDVARRRDDVTGLLLIARACEQRCILRAFGEGWTKAARDALEAGIAPPVVGDARQVEAAGAAAASALDLVVTAAPSLAPLAGDLAQSCLRLATTLQAVGAEVEAHDLLMRVEAMLRGPEPAEFYEPAPRAVLFAIEGGAAEGETTPPRRPQLSIVTSQTA
ncbi:hypothetical protein ACFQI3_06330 [Hansschlegelia quercus]|uniref:Uncharacterized protein n=1 Tax=Hansschlegelia quercus TaxID=2528245 RepID=A0A4Q9GQ91_9HYPH|nr:hypothetical protein [Hansschlegelia quercus]TBN53827.1 hypothetical protein EYR15_08510 [Hansschlegelia quercus]